MKAIVTNYHFELEYIESNDSESKAVYKIINDAFDGKLNITFDEPMCIDSISEFIIRFREIIEMYKYTILNKQNMFSLEKDLTNLLYQIDAQGYLFNGSMYEIMCKRPNMILLESHDYELIKQYESRQ